MTSSQESEMLQKEKHFPHWAVFMMNIEWSEWNLLNWDINIFFHPYSK